MTTNIRTLQTINSISHAALAICYVFMIARVTFGIDMPDMAIRIFGIINLAAIPSMVFTSIRLHLAKTERID